MWENMTISWWRKMKTHVTVCVFFIGYSVFDWPTEIVHRSLVSTALSFFIGQWCHRDCLQVSYQAGCSTVQQKDGSSLSEDSATGFCAKRKLIFNMFGDEISNKRSEATQRQKLAVHTVNWTVPSQQSRGPDVRVDTKTRGRRIPWSH